MARPYTLYSQESGNWSANNTWGRTDTELVSSGDMSDASKWSAGSGWAVNSGGSGVARATNCTSNLDQNPTHTNGLVKYQPGRTYLVAIDVSAYTSGNFTVSINGGTASIAQSGTGIKNLTLTAGATVATGLRIDAGTSLSADITSVSVLLQTADKPANDDTFIIQSGTSVLMDEDQSGFSNGMAGTCYIHGGVTPGMLYFKAGTSGYLKFSGSAAIFGTTSTNRGRLLVNATGVWGDTDPLPFADKAIFEGGSTANPLINITDLDVALYADNPTIRSVETYYNSATTYFEFNAATAIDISTNTITLGAAPPANAVAVKLRALGGATLPEGLSSDEVYYIYNRNATDNTCQLVYIATVAVTLVDITAVGSGTCCMYTDYTTAQVTQTFSVFEDVTGDARWTTASGHNKVILTNEWYRGRDNQRGTLSAITSNSMTITFTNASGNLDSNQVAGSSIFLVSRNVEIRCTATTTTSMITGGTNSAVLNCGMINIPAFSSTNQGQFYAYCLGTNQYSNIEMDGIISCFNYGFFGGIGDSSEISGVICSCNAAITAAYGSYTISGILVGAGLYQAYSTCNISGRIMGVQTGVSSNFASFTLSGTISGCNSGISTSSSFLIAETGSIKHCGNGAWGGYGSFTSLGTISGCNSAVLSNYNGYVVSGKIIGAETAVSGYGRVKLLGVEICNCTNAIQLNDFEAHNINLHDNVIDYAGYSQVNNFFNNLYDSGRSFNHHGVNNKTLGWRYSGENPYSHNTMTHETTEVPSGKSYSHKFTFVGNKVPMFFEWEITRPTGGTITIPVYAKHDTTGLSETERLHWAIVDPANDPKIESNANYLDLFIASDSTDWQSDTLVYARTDDRPLILRVWAQRASGNAWAYSEVITNVGAHRFPTPSYPPPF